MEPGATGGTGARLDPSTKRERRKLIAKAMALLNEEGDNEVLKSIVEVLPDLRANPDVRAGLKGFHQKGLVVIRKTPKLAQPSPSAYVMRKQPPRVMQSRLDHEIHPMNNELILKTIFAYPSVRDLKNCRLVSKQWLKQSHPSWQRKAVLKVQNLFEGSDVKQFNMARASDILEKRLYRYNVDYLNRFLSTGNRKVFLEFFSSTIKHLQIYCDDLDLLLLVLTKLPELRTVTLRVRVDRLYGQYKSTVSGVDGNLPFQNLNLTTSNMYKFDLHIVSTYVAIDIVFPWKQLFESVPNIKAFGIQYGNWHLPQHLRVLDDILLSFCQIRKEGNFSTLSLEELDLVDPLGPFINFPVAAVNCILFCKFPLQRLCIDLGNIKNLNTFWNLLKTHGKTLQYVKCNMRPSTSIPSPLYRSSKVELENVKKLVLGCWSLPAFNLLHSLEAPKLENLRIESNLMDIDHRQQLPLQQNLPNLEEFLRYSSFLNLNTFFYDGRRNFSKTELQALAGIMPNVKELTISLGDNILAAIYDFWPGLESLRILVTSETYPLLNDQTITGTTERFSGGVCPENRPSNITRLKNLRKFVVERKSKDTALLTRPKQPWITDLSAVHGFLKLQKLRLLHLEILCNFSADVLTALVDHVGNFKIREPDSVDDGSQKLEIDRGGHLQRFAEEGNFLLHLQS